MTYSEYTKKQIMFYKNKYIQFKWDTQGVIINSRTGNERLYYIRKNMVFKVTDYKVGIKDDIYLKLINKYNREVTVWTTEKEVVINHLETLKQRKKELARTMQKQ